MPPRNDEPLYSLPVIQNDQNTSEVLHFIECNNLIRQGIDCIDAHLLASTALADAALIGTPDKRLQKTARKLKLAID